MSREQIDMISVSGTPEDSGVPLPVSTEERRAEAGEEDITALLGTVSLYLHIPFCQAKCPYCDFNTYAGMLGLRAEYVDALAREILLAGVRARLSDGSPRRCRTVFFGGGTPSLLSGAEVAALLAAARSAFAVDASAEISLEVNPGSLEYGRLDELRAAGVTRLSMGAQSFDGGLLRWLGRLHTPEEIEIAFRAARTAGLHSINLDLMYALPKQSLAIWEETLARALALGPEHLSLYSLIIEEGTPLEKWVRQGKVRPADEDLAADMYELAEARLAAAGYEHYEISNWAQPGHACAHNLTYWHNLPYVGLGAGAHGWYARHRYVEARPIREYIARVRTADDADGSTLALPAGAVIEDETIGQDLEMAETAIMNLRLAEGLDPQQFERRFGRSFGEQYGEPVRALQALGLVESVAGRLCLTARGRLLGNEVFERLLPDETS
jgi:oxygen-independent coproporphyrinogen-3 oxidase